MREKPDTASVESRMRMSYDRVRLFSADNRDGKAVGRRVLRTRDAPI